MCACFDIGYVLTHISDDGRTASTVQRITSREYQQGCGLVPIPEYQQFLPPVSEQELCERVRPRIPVPMSTTDVWRGIT